ncbi:MAG: hypothetical protein ABSH23_05945 [Steroidobacteraceae bacterium]|jgi:hypothetical protein
MAMLLLNFAFFAWARWIDDPAQLAAASPPDPSIPLLQLAHAAVTAPAAPAASGSAAPPAAVAATAAAMRCRSLGPLSDEALAGTAAERLRAHGWNTRERNVESTVSDGYWVYIGYLKDAAAQRHMIATLNAAGIRDAAAMTQPEQSDRVSLGVFADQAHAMHRAEQVRELGFKPVLQIHERAVNQHWLDFERKAAEADPEPAELVGGSTAVQIADCPARSASG